MNLRRRHYATALKNRRCWLLIAIETAITASTLISYPITSPITITTLCIGLMASWMCIFVYVVDAERDEYNAEVTKREARREQEIHDKFVVPLQELVQRTNGNSHTSTRKAV